MKKRGKHGYSKKEKQKQDSQAVRADVLQALEEQRRHVVQAQKSELPIPKRKEIPGFFFDEERGKYFPLSMKRDSVYVQLEIFL
mgnify:CR=1 FL=1